MFNDTKYSEKKDISLRNHHEIDPIILVLLFLGAVSLGVSVLLSGLVESAKLSRLPLRGAEVGNPKFGQINMIPGVTSSSRNGKTMELAGDDILLVGYIKHGNDDFVPGRVWNPELALFSLNYVNGNINWQAEASLQSVLVNDDKVYVVIVSENTGIAAYNITSGEPVWRTYFDSINAIGVDHFAASSSKLFARTYHRSNSGFYVLDLQSGEIVRMFDENIATAFFAEDDLKTIYRLDQYTVLAPGTHQWSTRLINDCSYCSLSEPVVTERFILVKSWGLPYHGFLHVLDRSSGNFLWRHEEHIISNIAVDGETAFFLTASSELVAVNVETGANIATLNFTPDFPKNFDFENGHFLVTAKNNVVAVYFGDSRQLFIFRFQ